MHGLEVRNLVKKYQNTLVVDDISFQVADGEFFVLLGPSGGGKSTILRLISGLEAPDAGQVFMSGRDITTATPRERNLGMVFQDYGIYPNMNVFDNIAYGLQARKMGRAEIEKRIKITADKLGLAEYLPKLAIDLSGGEQQRVALARAMVKDADTYLFDEPLANLDPKLRYRARRDIQSLHRQKQKPSIYVTHDQSEAFAMADRIAVIAKGRLQQVGTPDEILQSPANTFMARFIGTPPMNVLEGECVYEDDRYQVKVADLRFSLDPTWKHVLQATDASHLLVGLNPAAFIPAWELADYPDAMVHHAQIEDVEPLIGEVVLTLRLTDGSYLRVLCEDSGVALPEVGHIFAFALDEARICLFDILTEKALQPAF
ncbi:ABC transporter ATP-binding protein [Dictyobacter alpinus]|uniref:ABC transporter ATP-binding protein n=1 Tax=Dictyobacter alpinus TaxID=2014873 RepID=A0A402BE61_9CHLR|nr:ABC transporter ATP-binding protein [Dictyobacter alpinus]GCE29688.1 ABC transporter ATP-binding protein [Dictyobacter alpinus]